MKIYTRIVLDMSDLSVLEADCYEYSGPVALCGSGGGSEQTQTVSEPWSQAQPYILEGLMGASNAFQNPPQYFPGQTFIDPTRQQQQAWGQRLNYMDQVFGGSQAPDFSQATGALSGALTGKNSLGGMAGQIAPFSTQQLMGGFKGPSQIGNYDPTQYGGVSAMPALQGMLSGQGDYSGLQQSIDAANAPIMRQFEQDILPGLEEQASFLQNPTGSIKSLNRVLPEMGERMSLNAGALTEQERIRALGAQQQAAGMVGQLGMQGANFGLATDQARAAAQGDYRSQLLGLGGLGGQLAGQQQAQALQGAGMFPMLAQAGEVPGILGQQYADWGAGYQQQALNDQMNRFNFNQNQPMDMASWYANLAYGGGGMGGSSSQTMPGMGPDPLTMAAGGAATGSAFGPWGALIGGMAGYGMGAWG